MKFIIKVAVNALSREILLMAVDLARNFLPTVSFSVKVSLRDNGEFFRHTRYLARS